MSAKQLIKAFGHLYWWSTISFWCPSMAKKADTKGRSVELWQRTLNFVQSLRLYFMAVSNQHSNKTQTILPFRCALRRYHKVVSDMYQLPDTSWGNRKWTVWRSIWARWIYFEVGLLPCLCPTVDSFYKTSGSPSVLGLNMKLIERQGVPNRRWRCWFDSKLNLYRLQIWDIGINEWSLGQPYHWWKWFSHDSSDLSWGGISTFNLSIMGSFGSGRSYSKITWR